jgi:hypothetical protein
MIQIIIDFKKRFVLYFELVDVGNGLVDVDKFAILILYNVQIIVLCKVAKMKFSFFYLTYAAG